MTTSSTMTKEQIFSAIAVCTDHSVLARIADVINHKDSIASESTDPDLRLITQTEAAKRLGISRVTAWRLLRDGQLQGVNVRGKVRVRMDSVMAFALGKAVS